MAIVSPRTWLRRRLAALVLAASAIVVPASAQTGVEPLQARIAAAAELYFEGRSLAARTELERLAQEAAKKEPAAQAQALEALLDICIASYAADCLARHAARYAEAAMALPAANEMELRERARRAIYYRDYARFMEGSEDLHRQILAGPAWGQENAFNGELYIRRQLLAANLHLVLGDQRQAEDALDKVLSLIAASRTPQAARFPLAQALSRAIDLLTAMGDIERAHGVRSAVGEAIAQALPPLSVEFAVFRLVEGRLLQEVGDLKGAENALAAAVATLRRIELDGPVRDWLLSEALALQAVACTGEGRLDCAQAALAAHPHAALYAHAGRRPESYAEVAYLAARALLAAVEQRPDPVAAEALAEPLALGLPAAAADKVEIWRAAGAALSRPPGAGRQAGLLETARRIRTAAERQPAGGFGAWYRPGAVDHILLALALTQAESEAKDAPETMFALMQLAGRRAASFDSDALSALSQADNELQRRAIHQALRLRARRNQLERAELHAVVARWRAASPARRLEHDPATRLVFRDFAGRIDAAAAGLAQDGLRASGSNVVALKDVQAILGPQEAMVTTAQVPGGLAYMCVRRDSTFRKVAAADLQQAQLDTRILQQALTAGHAPSDALDSQYPVAAAMRLYDLLIRPFEACLKPGDHILWLPSVSLTQLPLAALLRSAPPKLGEGYDLSQAEWLVKRHAITYAGSANVILAARTGGARAGGDFDFLGVGDPILSGLTGGGEDRGKMLLRGVRSGAGLASLAPLPETRDELEESARGFAVTKLLMQESATEHAFRSELVGSYRLLSFATHGLLREDLQGLSEPALALTPVSSTDAANDGLLTASEIADLNLSARFVALSACNTANFDLTQMAEDLPALASAFAVAGTPATLATLWPVDSESSKRVVAATFAGLRETAAPAEALAEAQRAFLAASPSRAHLHPRFWAPFVLLGDGGAPVVTAPRQGRPSVRSVEVLTKGQGEVVALNRSGEQVLARLISDPDAAGRHGAAARLSGPGGAEAWRRDTGSASARLALDLGDQSLVGGYAAGPDGRFGPTLDLFDRGGRLVKSWRGEAGPGLDAFLLSGVKLEARRAAFVVAEKDLRGQKGAAAPRVRVFTVDADLAPRLLFEAAAPAGVSADEATLTRLGDGVLLTFSRRLGPIESGPPQTLDDFELPLCGTRATTWLELRDAGAGELRAARTLDGHVIVAALARGEDALLGGAAGECATDARAVVLAVGADLAPRTLHRDESLGDSEVRGLGGLPGGRTFVASRKQGVVDYRSEPFRRASIYAHENLQVQHSVMLLTLGPDGAAGAPQLLASGSSVLVSSADSSRPGDILLGGALGGRAAIFHVSTEP